MAILFDERYGNIEFFERPDSLKASYTAGTLSLKRVFDTDWDTRWIFARRMVGYSFVNTDTSGRQYIARVPPHAHEPMRLRDATQVEGSNIMYCTDLESMEPIKPLEWNETDQEGLNLLARCTFNYSYLPYVVKTDEEIGRIVSAFNNAQGPTYEPTDPARFGDVIKNGPYTSIFPVTVKVGPNTSTIDRIFVEGETSVVHRYISKVVQPSAQHLILPYGSMRFVDGTTHGLFNTTYGTKATNTLVKIIPKAELTYTWHRVPSTDVSGGSHLDRIQRFLGKVNSDMFDGYKSGTLLFLAVNSKPYRQIGGYYALDIELKMTYFEMFEGYSGGRIPAENGDTTIGHNYFIHFPESRSVDVDFLADGYRYDLITANGQATGRRVFEAARFRDMFSLVS